MLITNKTPFLGGLGAALICASALCSTAQAEPAEDLLIIANRSLRVGQVSPAALKQIFLRQRTSLSGTRIVPLNARPGTATRALFRARVLKMTPAEEARHWQALRIRGEERAPTSFRNTLKAVFKVRGAIGYVPRSKFRKGVARILLVIPPPKGASRSKGEGRLTESAKLAENLVSRPW